MNPTSDEPRLGKYRHDTQMYGPPPDCKRFEVGRRDSLRKCIRPLSGESLSGHLMMIRTCRSFKIPRSPGTRLSVQVFRHAVGLFFRLLLSSADLGGKLSAIFVVVAVGKWKAFCAFQAQRLFHGHQ